MSEYEKVIDFAEWAGRKFADAPTKTILEYLLQEAEAGNLKGFTGIVQLEADLPHCPAIIVKVRSDIDADHATAAIGALESLKFDIMINTFMKED